MSEALLCVHHSARPDGCEDSFGMRANETDAWLCVADGCGGIGGRRYAACENRTGAFLASRLAIRAFQDFTEEGPRVPDTPQEGAELCRALESRVDTTLCSFAEAHGLREGNRVVGALSRLLPTTLCGALAHWDANAAVWDACFLWAGDSRGYVLDADGLHQCTRDHLRGEPDALQSLRLDAPLSRFLSADQKAAVSLRRLRLNKPGLVLLATDGVYSALPTPMAFERLLRQALLAAESWEGFCEGLRARVARIAQDDATLLALPVGSSFAHMKALAEKRAMPEAWQTYRETYDWTEDGKHGGMDWRI